jgi:ribosomal protein S27AE
MSIDVRSTDEDEICPRCGTVAVMSLTVPGRPAGAGGIGGVAGVGGALARRHVLCERCDIGEPAAGALITFLAVHSPVQPEQANELADYVRAWVSSVGAR